MTTHCHFTVPRVKQVRVITDTDFFNEADDPFAVAQALLSPKFDNVALVAVHCGRGAEQMEESYRGLQDMVAAMAPDEPVTILHGAPHALPNQTTPVVSKGAECIVREAMKDDDRPLFVLLLGPLTDLASALLMEPRIAGRVTAIWIGGGAYPVGGPEFNLGNDIAAVNVVFGSTMAVWQVPKNVYEMMPVSLAELDCLRAHWVAGCLTSWTPTTSPTLPLPVPSAPAKHGCWATILPPVCCCMNIALRLTGCLRPTSPPTRPMRPLGATVPSVCTAASTVA